MITVSEDGLSRALLLCLERAKQVVEQAGAAAVAALLEHPGEFEPPVVAVLSGGNIDPLLLSKLLRHGLTAAGRYLAFRSGCRISPDRWRDCSAPSAWAPTSWRSATSASRPACSSMRSRSSCRWRRAAPITAKK